MTSAADEQQHDASKGEPPSKKRRSGRRSSNPSISAEERKRLRVLKNRESAMRSLAKKAEYSAKLETLEKEAAAQHKSKREKLEKLLETAIALRTALDKVPDDIAALIARVESSINRCTTLLAAEDIHEQTATQTPIEQTNQDPATNAIINGDTVV
eukprot:GFKZ01001470.1.p1 GENE.GFKZ01001470.1~~GFKZ01001470.1.p1  ORF type:complete len:156 (-),score=30.03 GFKZ01001470.1:1509-1976(-)